MPFPLLQIKNLSVDFVTESGSTTALKNISFTIERGETVAGVRENGNFLICIAITAFSSCAIY